MLISLSVRLVEEEKFNRGLDSSQTFDCFYKQILIHGADITFIWRKFRAAQFILITNGAITPRKLMLVALVSHVIIHFNLSASLLVGFPSDDKVGAWECPPFKFISASAKNNCFVITSTIRYLAPFCCRCPRVITIKTIVLG